MATPGYDVRLYLSGESTAMTDESMTQSGATKTYYTGDATKNLWDPDATFVVKDATVVVATTNYTIDWLLGEVTFDASYTVNGAITVTGNYLPRYLISTARGFSVNLGRTMLDTTVFGDSAVDRLAGLYDATGTIERLDQGLDDFDTGGSSGQTIYDGLSNDAFKVIEIQPDTNDDEVLRVLTQFESNEISSAPDDLTTAALAWQGRLTGTMTQSFSWGDPTA